MLLCHYTHTQTHDHFLKHGIQADQTKTKMRRKAKDFLASSTAKISAHIIFKCLLLVKEQPESNACTCFSPMFTE